MIMMTMIKNHYSSKTYQHTNLYLIYVQIKTDIQCRQNLFLTASNRVVLYNLELDVQTLIPELNESTV